MTGSKTLATYFDSMHKPGKTTQRKLASHWYSVVFDIGLFLGNLIIDRHPQLRRESTLGESGT